MSAPESQAVHPGAHVLWRDDAGGGKRARSDKPGEILKLLARSMRHAVLYGAEHPVVQEVLHDLHEFLQGPLSSRPSIRLIIHEDTFFVENTVLIDESVQYESLLVAFRDRQIGAVQISAGLEPGELRRLTEVLNLKPEEVQRLGGPGAYLESHGVRHITAWSAEGVEAAVAAGSEAMLSSGGGGVAEQRGDSRPLKQPGQAQPVKVDPHDVYRTGLRVMDELTYHVSTGIPLNLRKAQKVINYFIDSITGDGAVQLGVTALKNYDEDTYHHSLNVCILSLLIGSHLKMNRTLLTTLGLASLLHDIGKTRVPREILISSAKLAPDELAIVKRHPVYGAHALRGLPEFFRLAMVVAFEHHANYNLTGYPQIRMKKVPHLLTRIVQVADVFDAATSSRRAYRQPKLVAEVLKIILEGAGTLFDPVLAKLSVKVFSDLSQEISRRSQSPSHTTDH